MSGRRLFAGLAAALLVLGACGTAEKTAGPEGGGDLACGLGPVNWKDLPGMRVAYPHGSPFPPGKEPAHTHTARVYWTTFGGMVTKARVKADGGRPSQVFADIRADGTAKTVRASIHPGCSHAFHFAAAKPEAPEEGVEAVTAKGHGVLRVEVFGFKKEDFETPPTVTVEYLRDGKTVSRTDLAALPAARPVLPKEKRPVAKKNPSAPETDPRAAERRMQREKDAIFLRALSGTLTGADLSRQARMTAYYDYLVQLRKCILGSRGDAGTADPADMQVYVRVQVELAEMLGVDPGRVIEQP